MKPIPDVWTETDFPVLLEVARRAVAPTWTGRVVRPSEVADALGRSDEATTVTAAVLRLIDGGYLVGDVLRTQSLPPDAMIKGLTPAGLRAAGAWPSEERGAAVVIAALEELADRLAPTAPEDASRIRAAAGAVGRGLGTMGLDLLNRLIAHQLGLP